HDVTKRWGIAHFPIQPGRSPQIREDERHMTHRDPFPGAKRLAREEIAKDLESDYLRGGGRLIRPGRAFDEQKLCAARAILEPEDHGWGKHRLARSPAIRRGHDGRLGATIRRDS